MCSAGAVGAVMDTRGALTWLCEIIFKELDWDLWPELHCLHGWERWIQMQKLALHSVKLKHKGSQPKSKCLFWMSYVQPRAKVKYILLGLLFQVWTIQHIPQTRSQGQRLRIRSLGSSLWSNTSHGSSNTIACLCLFLYIQNIISKLF